MLNDEEALCNIPVPQSELDQSKVEFFVGLTDEPDMYDMSSGWHLPG